MPPNPSADPTDLRRFTRVYPLIKDPPWLPIAAWIAIVLPLAQLGYVGAATMVLSLAAASAATVVAKRWFRRTYGVVTPTHPLPLAARPGTGFALLLLVFALEALSQALGWRIRLGILAFGAALAWSAWAFGGFRNQLLILAAICAALAFLPFVVPEPNLQYALFYFAFGIGWCVVCVWDYRVIAKAFATHGREPHVG
jgi:hypothetical protein